MFNSSINDLKIKDLSDNFSKDGYIYLPSALSNDFINLVNRDIAEYRHNFNNNKPGGISTKSQYFNSFMLAISDAFYKYCTSNFVLDLSKELLNSDDYRLKSLRYYETRGNHRMQWHTDTKNYKGFKNIPGIIFICYVSKVNDGEFQYIEGSHKFSQEYLKNDFSNDWINKNKRGKIISFKGNPGDLIIYNTAGIHRAKPSIDKKYCRASLFFQVDIQNDSERIWLNQSFIDPLNLRVMKYLGFGQPATYPEYPVSNITDASLSLIIRKVIIPKLKSIPLTFVKSILPSEVKNILKKFI